MRFKRDRSKEQELMQQRFILAYFFNINVRQLAAFNNEDIKWIIDRFIRSRDGK